MSASKQTVKGNLQFVTARSLANLPLETSKFPCVNATVQVSFQLTSKQCRVTSWEVQFQMSSLVL